jgi:TPR repeat protein
MEHSLKRTIFAGLATGLLAFGMPGAAGADQFANGMAAAAAHDYATTLQLWRPLADEGSSDAQNGVGVLYDNGMGVVVDHAKAAEWFKKSADQGNAAGELDLALAYDLGRGLPKNDTMAAYWYHKAADQGLPVAQQALGQMYADGRSLPKDLVQAYYWISLSITHFPKTDAADLAKANKARDQIAATMSAEQMDAAWKLVAAAQAK